MKRTNGTGEHFDVRGPDGAGPFPVKCNLRGSRSVWFGARWVKLSGVKPDGSCLPTLHVFVTLKRGYWDLSPDFPSVVDSDGDDNEEGVAGQHLSLVTKQDDRAGGFGENRGGRTVGKGADRAEFFACLDVVAQRKLGLEDAGVRGGVMGLQMGFFGVGGLMERLGGEWWFGTGDATGFEQQILQTARQCREVCGCNFSGAPTLGVDGGNLAGERGAEGASRQEWSGPAPERIKAGSHGALGGIEFGATADDVTDPRVKRERVASAVQIDVVGGVRKDLSFEEVRQPARRRTVRCAGEGAGEISVVGGMAASLSTGMSTTVPCRLDGCHVSTHWRKSVGPSYSSPCVAPLITNVGPGVRPRQIHASKPSASSPNLC